MIESCLVLIGSFKNDGKGETFGTGIIIKYKNQLYIISCKHVYHGIRDKNVIFAIPKPKQTMEPKGGYAIIYLDKPVFHPDDNDSTYDVVAFKLLNNNETSLSFKNIFPLNITTFSEPLSNSQELFGAGFPVSYVKRLVANRTEDILSPQIVSGHEIKLDISKLSQIGFQRNLKEGFFIETNDDDEGKGSSGGLIFRMKEDESIDPIGIRIGRADIELTFPNGKTRNINAIIFTQMKRVIETIAKIK